MTTETDAPSGQDIGFSATDGLQLYGRLYKAAQAGRRPLLCLAGLTRNCRDFHMLALALSQHPEAARDVYCLDSRGRGRSAYDSNWHNYTPYVEMLDALDFMTVTGLHDAALLGTSRGGIITMLMAAVRPTAIGVAILNDIGPVIDATGLARIVAYVGRTPTMSSWADAARLVRQINAPFFPKLSDEDWSRLARQWFDEENGQLRPAYDPRLGQAIAQIDLTRKIPDTWPQFLALSRVPTLVIRGEKSDLLSEATLQAMADRHPRLQSWTVEDQGHAPLLWDKPTTQKVSEFLISTDAG